MIRKQRGVTMIGWIFLLTPMAVVLYAGLRAGPEYLNYYKVSQALKETAVKLKSDESITPDNIRSSLEKRFDTGYIDKPTAREIVITKVDGGWQMLAEYESVVPMFGNMNLLLAFKSTVVIN